MSEVQNIHQILKKYWGFDSFREKQEEIIQSILNGKDTLALLPTGGGKSICFQVPAIAMEGLCLVISPLIALMQDQVENLKSRGIKAIAITSGMSKREIDIGLDNAAYGNYKFLYVSPERLDTELFKARLKKMKVNMLAIDEAHCISQWGYDFRPSYLNIAKLKSLIPNVPFLALTATATPTVVTDIQEKLEFKTQYVIQKSFERKNIAYVVVKADDQSRRMLNVIDGVPGSGIIYVNSRKKTKEIVKTLLDHNISSDLYHAGLSHVEREEKQRRWIKNQTRVIVATNAFGMGIDKPDVRFVIHLDLPQSLEAYFQEAGRAGRDGRKAYAVLIHSPSMSIKLKQKVEQDFPEINSIKLIYQSLANYFQIPLNGGLNQTFDFDIKNFAQQYKLNIYEVYKSIHFLEKEGYLSISEHFFLPSRIHIPLSKEDLYKFQISNKNHDTFIKTLLRTYGGMFDDFVTINETVIARNLKSSKTQVIEILNRLNTLDVISYQAQSNLPKVSYTTPRLEQGSLRISKQNYASRKKIALDQSKAVIDYAESASICRSIKLLNYFGDKGSSNCGICDICLEQKNKDLSNDDFKSIEKLIQAKLSSGPLSLAIIVDSIKAFPKEKIIQVIEFLIENDLLKTDGINYSIN